MTTKDPPIDPLFIGMACGLLIYAVALGAGLAVWDWIGG